MQQRHFFQKIFLAILGVSLLLVLSWLPFTAHIPTVTASSFVTGSDPIDGSTISTPPSVVRIYFNAPLASPSQGSVYAFSSNAPANGELVNAGKSSVNATRTREMDIPLLAASKLPEGSYEVRWTAISLTDGRTTSGLIGFNLGQSSSGISGTPILGPTTSNNFPQLDLQGVLSVAWEWLMLLALLFWIGILVTDFFLVPRTAPEAFQVQARQHSRSLQAFCLLALLTGETINLILRSTSLTQTWGGSGINITAIIQLLIDTNYGAFWLARAGLLVFGLLFLWWTRYPPSKYQETGSASSNNYRSTHMSQLRQQVRQDTSPELPAAPKSTPMPTRPQARVTGAIVANVSPVRSTTAALPRITLNTQAQETSIQAPSRWWIFLWLTVAGLVILTLSLTNELTQLTQLSISAGIFLWLSLAAQGVWLGCIAYLGITLFPLLPVTNPDNHTETLVSVLKQATPFLLSSIAVLLVSNIFLTEATIQGPDQFFNTPYGLAALVRGSLLLLALIFTIYMLFFLQPRLQRQTVLLPVVNAELPARRTRRFALEKTALTIRRALHALAILGAAALICTALMDFFAPPIVYPNVNYAQLLKQTTTGSLTTTQTRQVGKLSVTLQALPGQTGVTNTILLTVHDAQGKAVTDATIKLTSNMQIMNMGTSSVTAIESNGIYLATFSPGQSFTMAGSWILQVAISQPHQPAAQTEFTISIAS